MANPQHYERAAAARIAEEFAVDVSQPWSEMIDRIAEIIAEEREKLVGISAVMANMPILVRALEQSRKEDS